MKNITEHGGILLPEFIISSNKIHIPKKTHKSINFIPKEYLLNIHPNIKVAKELCLYFLSFLIETNFDKYIDGKHLSTEILAKLLGASKTKKTKYIYQSIIIALIKGTPNKGPFIEVDRHFVIGVHTRKYNLSPVYKCGIQIYEFKTNFVIKIKAKNYLKSLVKTQTNIITRNSLMFYTQIDLPTKEFLLEKGKQLCKSNFHTKKGKKLTMLYKHNYKKRHDIWKDANNRSFVEKNIEMFEYYTANGFMLPQIGGEHCPRVYDSISLLPSWIRNEITINGKPLFEVDYKCLHPNLIMNIYNGKLKNITHQKVADYLEIYKSIVKTKHLSFFNMKIEQMYTSKLMKYYIDNDLDVIEKIMNDKKEHKSHKITSYLTLNLEVQIMNEVIRKLNDLDIYVGYIYDAILTTKDNIEIVLKIMNETVLEFKVYTVADTNCKAHLTTICGNTLETKESSLEVTKTIDKKTYNEMVNNLYSHTQLNHRGFKENRDYIINELYKEQITNKKKALEFIKYKLNSKI